MLPEKVPPSDGIDIEWVHPTTEESFAAAKAMCISFNTTTLGTKPALASQHELRVAIDMTIKWSGDLIISNKNGNNTTIDIDPKTGMNSDLIAVGAAYGVIKYNRTGTDKPHWSSTGQ
ncbi:hypothetical protein [Roseateles koreensis]|uniref:Uncharacterized protein n=1 Tax=Roseateles koreensis TaxID=2987526 RepID=A0ABT5KT34_9BURK|nr:hypothetical protein [Roseateles koreensis]MDC8786099.1 hypothetical protein [Roseateles koreensis]